MNARKHRATIAGGCIAVFAACAFAQAPTASTPEAAASTQPAAATKSEPTGQTAAAAKTHHPKKDRKSVV